MRKKISFLFVITLYMTMAGACAKETEATQLGIENVYADSIPYGGRDAVETMIFETDSAEVENKTYEYEVQELYAGEENTQIYGIIYIPQNAGEQMPTVIYSHGFGDTHQSGLEYAGILAENGYVVYCFDFCGGGPGSKSDGSMAEMSLMTEQADLETVLNTIKEQPYVDKERIVLLGASQGGAVSAVTAAAHKEEVAGLVLLYPAFVMADDTRKRFSTIDEVPETYSLMGMTVGRRYAEALWDYDFYEVIPNYDKMVLLIHGDADRIVPIAYSERAAQVYPSAQLEVFQGAGHGFYGNDVEKAAAYILEYLNGCI